MATTNNLTFVKTQSVTRFKAVNGISKINVIKNATKLVDINPNERRVYLTWLSKAMNSKTEWTKRNKRFLFSKL